MTLYIDSPLWPAHGTTWSHLVSDASLAELHDFAVGSGLQRRAFDLDHYDVPAARVADLVAAGAVATSGRDLLARLTASGLRVRGRDRVAAKRTTLLARWTALLPGVPGAEAVGEELLTRWYEPHRTYHGPGHLTHVLDSLAVLEAADPAPRAVHLALWFHDAVHDGVAGADEAASAALARELLGGLGEAGGPVWPVWSGARTGSGGSPDPAEADEPLGPTTPLTEAEIAEVVRLVLVTADHSPAPGDAAGALVCDADLAILASAPDRYARYVSQVRTEYAHVPDDAFATGRAAILERLLTTAPLFRTTIGAARWEEAAQENLRAELTGLTRPAALTGPSGATGRTLSAGRPAANIAADITVITVATVCLYNSDGLLLTVRKRGTSAFMLPGGKPDPGEHARSTACREVQEELGLTLPGHSLSLLGTWRAPAANEAGAVVEATVFRSSVAIDHARPAAEIEEVAWIDVHAETDLALAPMLTEHVLPALRAANT